MSSSSRSPARSSRPVGRARRAGGFTLLELMIVVAIAASMAGGFSTLLGGRVRIQEAATLGRGVLYQAARARAAAITTSYQHRLQCAATGCTVYKASVAGMSPTNPTWTATTDTVPAGAKALVYGMDPGTDVSAFAPTGFTTQTIVWNPDGSAAGGTVFVEDASGARKYKVYVYAATGLARMVDTW